MTIEVTEPPSAQPEGPSGPPRMDLRRDDYGAFRALEPGSQSAVLARPAATGLQLQRLDGSELVPWSSVTAVELSRTEVGRARVPTARVRLAAGQTLDLADALAPGSAHLPATLEAGGPLLLRVERFRLLCAAIVAGATLESTALGEFRRCDRRIPIPELALRRKVLPSWAPPLLLVASVFVLVYFFPVTLSGAVAITAVMLVHELGHVVALRMAGMKVRGVLFLPFVGAATLPEHSFHSRWHEIWVHLAGPLTAIPAAGLGLLAWRTGLVDADTGATWFWWALGVNLLNLFPLLPLDGGRIVLAVTAGLPRVLRLPTVLAPLVGLVVLVVLIGEGHPLGFLAFLFLAFSLFVTRMALRRDAFYRWMGDGDLPLGDLRLALRDITFAFSGAAREDVDGGVPPVTLTPFQRVVALGAYTATCAALCVATLAAAQAFGLGGLGR